MDKNEKIISAVTYIGMLGVLAGLLIPIFAGPGAQPGEAYKYIFAAGAALTLIGRLFTRHRDGSMRLRRLYRIESWSAVCFCVGAFFLFYDPLEGLRNAIAFTMAGGLVQLYASVMIPRELRKQQERQGRK